MPDELQLFNDIVEQNQISLEIEEEKQDGDGSLGTFNVIQEENKNLIFEETARA